MVSLRHYVAPPTPDSRPLLRDQIVLVDNVQDCAQVCSRLAACQVIAVDCEGINLGSNGGDICLIQISDGHNAYLFDSVLCSDFFEHGLHELLSGDTPIKVLHDVRADSQALLRHGCPLSAVFDTQTAFQELNPEHTQVGLSNMLDCMKLYHPEKTNSPHKQNWGIWAKRPMTEQMLRYAAYDVILLLEAAYVMEAMLEVHHLKSIAVRSRERHKGAPLPEHPFPRFAQHHQQQQGRAQERLMFDLYCEIFTGEANHHKRQQQPSSKKPSNKNSTTQKKKRKKGKGKRKSQSSN